MKAGAGETRDLRYYLAASVSLLTFLVYLPALQNDFVGWDDDTYVVNNPHIRSFDISFFKWTFFDCYAANWHPLTWISHALDYTVWGLNPMGHHLTNNILHAVNTFLVVLLVTRLMEVAARDSRLKSDDSRFMLVAAAVTGLLFGLHPVHVESVAWVAERKDLLCGLFYLMSVKMYVKYGAYPLSCPLKKQEDSVPRPCGERAWEGWRWYLLCLSLFTLALMSKPMAVSLPVVLLILDWYPLQRITSLKTFRTACIEKIPFIGLSIFSSIVTVLSQKTAEATEMMGFVPLSARLLVASKSLFVYFWKMVFPVSLIPYYPYPREISLFSLEYFSTIAFVFGVTATCLVVMKKRNLMLSAWCYYLVTLFPVLGIIQVGHQSMADRYTYLPSLGPFLIVGLLAAWISKDVNSLLKFAAGGVTVFVLVFLAYRTFEQIRIWKDGLTLWTYVIQEEPKQAAAYYYRGVTREETGQFDKAAGDYEKALVLNPWHYGAYNNRGVLYGKAGFFDKAIEHFNKSIEINPHFSLAYGNRGYTYSLLGQNNEALVDFNKAIELDRNFARAYFNRGNLYFTTGNKTLAVSDFQKACSLGDEVGCYSLRLYGL